MEERGMVGECWTSDTVALALARATHNPGTVIGDRSTVSRMCVPATPASLLVRLALRKCAVAARLPPSEGGR